MWKNGLFPSSISRFSPCVATSIVIVLLGLEAFGQTDGAILREGQRVFPIGSYELPKDDNALKAMADAGVNLVRCRGKDDLDRAYAVGMLGVLPLPLQQGATDALRQRVQAVVDHPALAVWEGPDEVVWNFTAYSGLHRKLGVHKTAGEWRRQTPDAIAYAEQQAAKIIPNMRKAAELIRQLDQRGRPIWINEAQRSDVYYVRQYLDFVDITGCDIYPVKAQERPITRIGGGVERWKQVGRGMPVWMVLQAFSWHELGEYYGVKDPAYPAFSESRFMAYDALVHGASGILYWGSPYLKSEPFRESLYALTSELARLQPFLVAPEVPNTRLSVVEMPGEGDRPNVLGLVRKAGHDWLIILVNEDDRPHMAVVVEGLEELSSRQLHLLYGVETATVSRGELIARMQPFEVKVYATSRQCESRQREGRDFSG